jgi:arylsulfatase A-like enzyme
VLSGEGEPGPTPDYVSSGSDRAALYRAPWKLYPEEPPLLYNIYADPLEQKDVAAENPEIVKAMSETLENWPTSEIRTQGILWSLLDPDSFGGEEDREPWADVARDRAAGGRP